VELQEAADKALEDGRNGNKNNVAFLRKNYEIERLITKLQEGKPVDEAQIDQALRPVHVWQPLRAVARIAERATPRVALWFQWRIATKLIPP
jgi:hypothetical protein